MTQRARELAHLSKIIREYWEIALEEFREDLAQPYYFWLGDSA